MPYDPLGGAMESEQRLSRVPDPDATIYVTLWRKLSNMVEDRLTGTNPWFLGHRQIYTLGPFNRVDDETSLVRVWRGDTFDTVILWMEDKGFNYLKDGSLWDGYFLHENYPPAEEELRARISEEELAP